MWHYVDVGDCKEDGMPEIVRQDGPKPNGDQDHINKEPWKWRPRKFIPELNLFFQKKVHELVLKNTKLNHEAEIVAKFAY